MKKISKDTRDTIIGGIFIALIVAVIVICGVSYKRTYDAYWQERVKNAQAQTELDIYNEMFEDILDWVYGASYYEGYNEAQADKIAELTKKYNSLLKDYDNLLESNKFDVRQVISDMDDVIEYRDAYESYVKNNPDVTFEQYLQLKNPGLLERLWEYANYY